MRLVSAVSICACLVLGTSSVSAAFIVVPPEFENVRGGLGGFAPFTSAGSGGTTTGLRTQLVYDASLFNTVSGPQLITAIQFRPIDPAGGIFGTTLNVSDVRLQLSTTQRSDENRNPLSTTFATNIGADVTTVFTGPLSLTTSSTVLANGTRAFDYTITLQTGFVYDPAAGNLLLDTLVPTGALIRANGPFGSFPRFDTPVVRMNDGLFSVRNVTSGSATTGTLNSSAPVTRFVATPLAPVAAVPEPASMMVAGIAGVGLLLGGRLRRKGKAGSLPG